MRRVQLSVPSLLRTLTIAAVCCLTISGGCRTNSDADPPLELSLDRSVSLERGIAMTGAAVIGQDSALIWTPSGIAYIANKRSVRLSDSVPLHDGVLRALRSNGFGRRLTGLVSRNKTTYYVTAASRMITEVRLGGELLAASADGAGWTVLSRDSLGQVSVKHVDSLGHPNAAPDAQISMSLGRDSTSPFSLSSVGTSTAFAYASDSLRVV